MSLEVDSNLSPNWARIRHRWVDGNAGGLWVESDFRHQFQHPVREALPCFRWFRAVWQWEDRLLFLQDKCDLVQVKRRFPT